MERRKFLLTSGTALLGSTAITGSRQPAIGLDFDLSADITADPSTVDSILVDFTKFELLPQYVDENAGKATITVTLEVENQNTVQYSTDQQLTNGEKVTKDEIGSMIPLVIDGIDTESSIAGDVRVEVEHLSVSDSYKQSLFISGDLILDGLVGWWPLNEKSGTTAKDVSGNNNDGNINGATLGVVGRNGLTAYSFDGSNDNVRAPDSSLYDLGIGDKLTVSVWVKSSMNTTEGNHLLIGKGDSSGGVNNVWDIIGQDNDGSSPDDLRFTYQDGSDDAYAYANDVLDGEWHHIVGTWNQDTGKVTAYVDGSQADSGSGNIDSAENSDKLEIGGAGNERTTNAAFLDGVISDARIYDRVLSDEEIQSMYDIGSTDFTEQSLHDGSDSGAVSRYTFDGDVKADSWSDNTLTNNTSASTTTDAIQGDAKVFDGSDDYMDTGIGIIGDSDGNYTISLWLKYNGSTSEYERFLGNYANGGDDIWIGNNQGDGLRFHDDKAGDYQTSSESAPIGSWIHLSMVSDANQIKAYKNGQLIGTDGSGRSSPSSTGQSLLLAQEGNGNYTTMKTDDVRIYDRDLSDEEVFELYQWGTRGKNLKEAIENYQSN